MSQLTRELAISVELAIQFFRLLVGFLAPIHLLNLYPFGRDLRLSQTSGMTSLITSMGGVGSLRLSHIQRGKRLANLRSLTELQEQDQLLVDEILIIDRLGALLVQS